MHVLPFEQYYYSKRWQSAHFIFASRKYRWNSIFESSISSWLVPCISNRSYSNRWCLQDLRSIWVSRLSTAPGLLLLTYSWAICTAPWHRSKDWRNQQVCTTLHLHEEEPKHQRDFKYCKVIVQAAKLLGVIGEKQEIYIRLGSKEKATNSNKLE